jgi:hypothetical protein
VVVNVLEPRSPGFFDERLFNNRRVAESSYGISAVFGPGSE